ncbi:MAG: heme biosynthesis HemY N-terminal domain-containing protein [Burkholderiaceae bacterium]
MRSIFWLLLLALGAGAAAMLFETRPGNVAFLLPPWRLDLSFNLFLVLLAALLVSVWLLARWSQVLAEFPERVRLYHSRREEIGAARALREAVRLLLEGRFARAERAARTARSAPQMAGIAALLAARAAHRMQEYERRDDWLARAGQDPEMQAALLLTRAELFTEQRRNEDALEAIDKLQSSGGRYLHATRIAMNANLQAGRWAEALKLVRALEKRAALHPVVARRIKQTCYRELLQQRRFDAAELDKTWLAIPAAERRSPGLTLEAARLLNVAGRGRQAAAAIEAALGTPSADWDDITTPRLLGEYARAQVFPPREQIERVEKWLAQPPRDVAAHAALLRTAGLLCLRDQLWGKARTYLEDSLRSQAHPATQIALARLAETTGEASEAAEHYRQAALGFADGLADAAASSNPGRVARREPLL